uniref:Family with sequence similarity 83 member G n=1 Tax=Xenopus tropicalis TaxID=8364 RepID=F7E596_XENTR
MALSQLQCLDNNHVNWRASESKAEFFYSEEQRLALEALLARGTDAFYGVVKQENIRDFLSELELSRIAGRLEPFDPDSGHCRAAGEDGELDSGEEEEDGGQSLEYWPERSDCSIPELDLGWPEAVAYRGVTRATVYMQPPVDGQPHIKEVVRKMINQAQKVIAVVMDHFTDIDIFKDLLDAGFKRKVSVYIILDETDVKYFLQMCEKAQMHKGHLKNLRIRSVGGSEFYTRFSTKFKGSLGQKFMFVDGDKAVCGSYSFTWSAARIDRNIITMLSGQVVETFDRQFQDLYLISKGVSLKNIPMENEPEPEPVLQPTSVPSGPSEAIAKKLINPKYALVRTKSASDTGAELKQEKNSKCNNIVAKPKAKLIEQPPHEQQKHPGLQNMEKANMFDYLPTWVEPDPEPGSDILGYINIIDPNIKNPQLYQMNRIKICDTSQATAQFLQDKEQELKQSECQGESEPNSEKEKSGCGNSETTTMRKEEEPSETLVHTNKLNQGREEVEHSPSPAKDSTQTSEVKKSSPSQSSGSKVSQTSQGEASMPSQTNVSGSQGEPPVSSTEEASAPSPAPCGNLEKEPVKDTVDKPPETSGKDPPLENFESLLKSQHLVIPSNKEPTSGPPVPKPRTLPVVDFISMKNAQNAKAGSTSPCLAESIMPSVNGLDTERTEDTTQNEKAEDDSDEGLQYFSSGSGSLPPSSNSSISEEYYLPTQLQRRNSEDLFNGEYYPGQRKMSDGHISRGSFLSPLQTMMDMGQMENGRRRNPAFEQELKMAMANSHPMHGNEMIYSMEPNQGYPFGSNGPSPSYDRLHIHHQAKNPGRARGRKESTGVLRGYPQIRKPEGLAARHGFWGPNHAANPPSPLTANPMPVENPTTPFGIPFSKLAQAKHLKTKMGASNLDSRRRGHGYLGHKDH